MTLASGRSGQNGSLPSLCFLLHALPASTCSPATHQAEHSGPVHVWALLPTTPIRWLVQEGPFPVHETWGGMVVRRGGSRIRQPRFRF